MSTVRSLGLALGLTLALGVTGCASTSTLPVASKSTPTVTVTPAVTSMQASQTLAVTVVVSGSSGTPTGTVKLSAGGYTSAATQLSAGSAVITVPAGSLPAENANPLVANYTPDTAGAATYTVASGIGYVKVSSLTLTPTVTVTLGAAGITSGQSLAVTVTVSGSPTPAGSVTVTSGSYSSAATTLTSGSAQITIPAGSLATGSDTLTATYTPSAASAAVYSSASGTATVTVGTTVTVDQVDKGPAVSNQLLGMNMVMSYDFTNGNAYTAGNSPIVSGFQEAGIVGLRWPGGSQADVYHWNGASTTNPATGVAPTPSTCAGANQGANTNYLSFIRNFENAIPNGFDVALTANYGTNRSCTGGGEPSEAASWVSYAYANGGKVSYVTVGNESYGSWEEDLHAAAHDAATYVNAVTGASGYYALIKAASTAYGGNTQVGVVVDAACTSANDCTDGWDSTVLGNAAGAYDFVEYHFYPEYSPPSVTSDTPLVQQAAQVFTYNINVIKQELSAAGEPNTPIYVGEAAVNPANPGTQSWSITQGLYAGQMLGEAMNDGVTRLSWWLGFGNCFGSADISGTYGYNNNNSSLYGWQNTWGSYNAFSDADANCPGAGAVGNLSPTAIAFQLFSHVAVSGQNVLTATVAGDTTDVRAYAATNPSGTALVLFNLNETTAQGVVVSLSSESRSAGVTEYTYDKEIYDYTNPSCQADQPLCTYDANHNYSTAQWVGPTTTTLGAQTLPMTVTLQPWSMNVLIIQ